MRGQEVIQETNYGEAIHIAAKALEDCARHPESRPADDHPGLRRLLREHRRHLREVQGMDARWR